MAKQKEYVIDPKKWGLYKESEHYAVYLEKNPISDKTKQMLIKYKQNGRIIQCIANDALFKLLFQPAEFKKQYMQDEKGKGSR